MQDKPLCTIYNTQIYPQHAITYLINQDVLHTQDRVNLYYVPTDGQSGKELAQVIDGIDYGGVEVRRTSKM